MAVIVDISRVQQVNQIIGAHVHRVMVDLIVKSRHVLIFHVKMEDLAA